MTIKITEQNRRILVRRWKYSQEHKRSLPETIYSVKAWSAPEELPDDVKTAHNVTEDEQQAYRDYVVARRAEFDKRLAEGDLRRLNTTLKSAIAAMEDHELKTKLTLKDYEELSGTINEIKKVVTKNKSALKRKSRKSDGPHIEVTNISTKKEEK